MNGFGFDDRDLDRLVDGELDEDRRRELLVQLETQPDGWRRCALRFLESQAFEAAIPAAAAAQGRKATGGPASASEPGTAAAPSQPLGAGAPPSARPRRRGPRDLRPWLNALAMAACFLIALNIGLQWRDGQDTANSAGRSAAQQASNVAPPAAPDRAVAARGQISPDWQTVTLAVPDGVSGGAAQIQLPCRESDQLDEQWLKSLPGAISPEARRALERNGYQVRQYRQLVPLPLEDGRRLVVPVDQVELRFVGNEVY